MEITNKDIIHYATEGEFNPCVYCGISFSHLHKAGTPPKEFKKIEEDISGPPYFSERHGYHNCKHCKTEYNYTLPSGYCDGCLNYIKHI